MTKLIEFLVSGCWHQWEEVDVNILTIKGQDAGLRITCKCSKCRKYRIQDLY